MEDIIKNKVIFKGNDYFLSGNAILESEPLDFAARNINGKIFDTKAIPGTKVVSFLLDINAETCNKQALKLMNIAKAKPELPIIIVSNNELADLKKWYSENNASNIILVSDRKYNEFKEKTNLYILNFDKLARGYMILEDASGKNVVEKIHVNKYSAQEFDYSFIQNIEIKI